MNTHPLHLAALILLLSFPQSALGASAPSMGFWGAFDGTTRWDVHVTEDETGCGGGRTTTKRSIPIVHHSNVAQVGDWGHGPQSGEFTRDTLNLPARTIPDGRGRSSLSAFQLTFTPDCMGFTGGYRWDYKDPQQRCSGTTSLRGTRADGKGCPSINPTEDQIRQGSDMLKEITDRRAEEKILKDALAKETTNFWANWDMAEMKKKQGDYKGYFDHLSRAVSNERISADTRAKLKGEARKQFHLSEDPTPETVPLLRIAQDEINGGGVVYNVEFPKPDPSNKERLKLMLWSAWMPSSSKLLRRIATE